MPLSIQCWEYDGSRTNQGYGKHWSGALTHRLAYEALVGPIPPGLQIDHLCRNRACYNPSHLEPVTARENILRGHTKAAFYLSRSECSQGHPFTPENTYMSRGARVCRECERVRSFNRYRGVK